MSKTQIPTGGIADDAISEEHIDATVITGSTALAATPDDTDEILISDGGTIKRIDYSYVKGGLVLLQDTTVSSAAANVTIGNATVLSSSYTNYILVGRMYPVASDGPHGMLRVDTSGGTQTADYKYTRIWNYSNSSDDDPRVDQDNSEGEIDNILGQSVHNTHGCNFTLEFGEPNNTSTYMSILGKCWAHDSSPDVAHHYTAASWNGGTDAIVGLHIYFSSGNIATGRFKLYGYGGSA